MVLVVVVVVVVYVGGGVGGAAAAAAAVEAAPPVVPSFPSSYPSIPSHPVEVSLIHIPPLSLPLPYSSKWNELETFVQIGIGKLIFPSLLDGPPLRILKHETRI